MCLQNEHFNWCETPQRSSGADDENLYFNVQ